MSRASWNEKKSSKRFYVVLYRRMINFLIVSLILNLGLSILLVNMFSKRPPHAFYATDGITPPMELSARSTPNEGSVP